MDRLTAYRSHIRTLLQRYLSRKPPGDDFEVQLIEDTEHDHYQIFSVGWARDRRIHGCTLHLDIKQGKIWIQHNSTEDDIAAELVSMGIPKNDIVLAFHAPSRRRYTGYAAN
ncbi:XisI protein [Candidatus Electrothrix marina]|uniref:XisI protein n=1 Tax=Candidatus Electrothrix marina TaxID=1859130 RepID=A0A444JGG8_9BACT|nr:XisI protein [Candidatus Electrothrix marina]